MPVVFSAITPHPPVLIPEIGKDNAKKLEKTEAAFKQLEQELYASKPESIIVISSHGEIKDDAFNINLNADYTADFSAYGDFAMEQQFKSDYMTIQEIRAADENNEAAPIVLSSEAKIDGGFSVPLYFLMQHLKQLPIIPITQSALDYEQHFKFGEFLYQQLARINKRFAVLAAADLSHTLTKDAPGGFSEDGQKFDDELLDMLKNKKLSEVKNIDPVLAKSAKETGLRPIIILSGILNELNIEPEVLSYEAPFGVGYAVVNFKIA